MREIILDCETTGLSPAQGHRVVELACVELVDRVVSGRQWQWYFNPERDVPKEAAAVHGLTTQFLRDKPLFASLISEITDVIGEEARLVIHNAPFDVGFLNAEFVRSSAELRIGMGRVTDTLGLARRKFPGSPASLDALCKRFGIGLGGREKHGALLDCELLARVYVELVGGRQMEMGLGASASDGAGSAGILVRTKALPPRLSEAEYAAHAEMVAGLGDGAIWSKYEEIIGIP